MERMCEKSKWNVKLRERECSIEKEGGRIQERKREKMVEGKTTREQV